MKEKGEDRVLDKVQEKAKKEKRVEKLEALQPFSVPRCSHSWLYIHTRLIADEEVSILSSWSKFSNQLLSDNSSTEPAGNIVGQEKNTRIKRSEIQWKTLRSHLSFWVIKCNTANKHKWNVMLGHKDVQAVIFGITHRDDANGWKVNWRQMIGYLFFSQSFETQKVLLPLWSPSVLWESRQYCQTEIRKSLRRERKTLLT